MAHSPQKVHCCGVNSDGQPCSAWAIHGSAPPLCSAHAGRKTAAAAPPKDQDHGTRRFYSSAFQPDELADLEACAEELSLDDEVATMRVTLRRILALFNVDGHQQGGAPTAMTHDEYARLARLALEGGRTVARLLRDRRALSGEAADGLAGAFSQALDELSTEWGVEL